MRATADKSTTRFQPKPVVRSCPFCGHHTLLAKGQYLVCRSCQQTTWRSES